MPTLHDEGGYALYMVMFDCRERPHVHVRGSGKGGAKVWLEPVVELATAGRYTGYEMSRILRIIEANRAELVERWNEECRRANEVAR